jgi:hypothetical protein
MTKNTASCYLIVMDHPNTLSLDGRIVLRLCFLTLTQQMTRKMAISQKPLNLSKKKSADSKVFAILGGCITQ